jgi:hypothetical protein
VVKRSPFIALPRKLAELTVQMNYWNPVEDRLHLFDAFAVGVLEGAVKRKCSTERS